jgi:hypothetical protein
MTKADWELLNRIVIETASRLQTGQHATTEDWSDIAGELFRAFKIAQKEEIRLDDLDEIVWSGFEPV